MHWKTARRNLDLSRRLVMGILNVTPDSFSDGGEYVSVDNALRHAEHMITDGADIIDIGGESTRPGSGRVSAEHEIERIIPIIRALRDKIDIPISVDTTKAEVAQAALDAGAEIINDISGLRWDAEIAEVAAKKKAGLVLMHSRGTFETMHSQQPVENIFDEVTKSLAESVATAKKWGVTDDRIAIDVGIGFGKTAEQNLELLANLDRLVTEFEIYPMLVGASRKSFIGKVLASASPNDRLGGSLAAGLVAVERGAKILRVHDVKETVAALCILNAINNAGNKDER
jgi:dihydropteroate synthase